jgi:Family of unknown function (DUF6084)
MFELDFQITGVEAAARGLIPLLHFKVQVTSPPDKIIHALMLHAQIQIESPNRTYNPEEKEKLVELFGTPDRWGQTLRNRLWTHSNTTVGRFSGTATATLPVQCSYDVNVAAPKYFYALDGGEVSLLFLFSGTFFYEAEDGRLQAQPISWNKESTYRMPVRVWRELMEKHYPSSAWLYLRRDCFDRLYAYKRSHGLATWEETVDRLLKEPVEVPA